MKDFFMKLLGYKKSPYQGYRTLTYDEYMAKLHESSERVGEIMRDRAATKNWLDAFSVGTWVEDEDGHCWQKKEDGNWYFWDSACITSGEMAKDGVWTYHMSKEREV